MSNRSKDATRDHAHGTGIRSATIGRIEVAAAGLTAVTALIASLSAAQACFLGILCR